MIAQTLGADFVVEATLETRSDGLRVTARLVDGVTDRKVWAEIFESPIAGATTLARRTAAAAAEALKR